MTRYVVAQVVERGPDGEVTKWWEEESFAEYGDAEMTAIGYSREFEGTKYVVLEQKQTEVSREFCRPKESTRRENQ